MKEVRSLEKQGETKTKTKTKTRIAQFISSASPNSACQQRGSQAEISEDGEIMTTIGASQYQSRASRNVELNTIERAQQAVDGMMNGALKVVSEHQ